MDKEQKCKLCGKTIYFDGICYECRTRLERERYLAMSAEEVQSTVEAIISGIETIHNRDKVYRDFNALLAYHNINTERIAEAALAKKTLCRAVSLC